MKKIHHMHSILISIEKLSQIISKEQLEEMGFPAQGEIELTQLEPHTWLLAFPNAQTNLKSENTKRENASSLLTPLHQKVLRLLKTHKTYDLIEGRFERLLSQEEITALNELVARGKIIIAKSNPSFEKGIYKENRFSSGNEKISKNTFQPPIPEKPVEEYSLAHDGFMVLRSDGAAKTASVDLAERIRGGEVKGIKSFDGFYYIIENELLVKYTPSVLQILESKKMFEIGELSASSGIPPVLTRIILEFAKEEGIVIEKQKNLFAYVG